MKHTCFGIGIVALTAYAIAGAGPCHAQNFVQNSNQLPDASRIHPSPLRVQIVDDNPIVTDTRHASDSTKYLIKIPTMPQGTNQVVQIGGNGDTGDSGSRPAQENFPMLRNNLPVAGLQSNIPAQMPVAARALPTGTSTNGLRNLFGTRLGNTSPVPLAKDGPVASNRLARINAPVHPAANQGVANYGETVGSTNGSQHVDTAVIGTIKRHSLLK